MTTDSGNASAEGTFDAATPGWWTAVGGAAGAARRQGGMSGGPGAGSGTSKKKPDDPNEFTHQRTLQLMDGAPIGSRSRLWDQTGLPFARLQFGSPPLHGFTPPINVNGELRPSPGYPSLLEIAKGAPLKNVAENMGYEYEPETSGPTLPAKSRAPFLDAEWAFKRRDVKSFTAALTRLDDFETERDPDERATLFLTQLEKAIHPHVNADAAGVEKWVVEELPEGAKAIVLEAIALRLFLDQQKKSTPKALQVTTQTVRPPSAGPGVYTVLQIPSHTAEWEKTWKKPFFHPGQLWALHQSALSFSDDYDYNLTEFDKQVPPLQVF